MGFWGKRTGGIRKVFSLSWLFLVLSTTIFPPETH